MAAADGVAARERDNVAVFEAHAVEDVAQVLRALRRVRQSTVGRAQAAIWPVDAAEGVRDRGATHELDGLASGERPQIRVRHVGALLLHALEQVVDDEQT